MLDDDNSTPAPEAKKTTSATTRRRAAGRPAGPPAAVSTDIFAAPAPAKAPRATSAPSVETADKPVTRRTPRRKPAASSDAAQGELFDGAAEAPKQAAAEPAGRGDQGTSAKKDDADTKRSTKKGSSKDSADPKDDGRTEQQGEGAPAKKKQTAAKKKDSTQGTGGSAAATAVAFQPPKTEVQPARRTEDADASEGGGSADGSAERTDDGGGDGDGSAPKRRRRSRGGRRRNKGDEGQDGQDATTERTAKGDDQSGERGEKGDDAGADGNGTTRRRRRRARAGEDAASSPDDPENTVVKVREGRSAEDEITGVTGSTRLEAKKQRRREGREAGRRRAPIVSEAEFLARRESVKREMVVRQHAGTGGDAYTQIAVLEDSVLVEHYVARESQTSIIGNVYLGKVQNVLPSMEAAFVDIGAGRNAVIYAGEVDWSGIENGKARKIEEALSPGQQILVQVTKDPIGQKGARLTSQISLPGRFLVYVPAGQTSGISRKLPDTERARLKALLKEVLPEDAGVIVRTAAEGATEDQLTRDVTALQARWEDISAKVGQSKAPQLLYSEPDLVIKVVRDLFNEDFASLVVEGPDAWDNISGYIQHVAPDLAERLSEWVPAEHDGQDSFAALRLDEQIHKALDRKVWLPSGGSLVIDRTEAMTVVDVNTGKFTGSGGNLEETVTKNNLEAAEEIVRQLRLRDIGGIIVIDFIDMVLESNRELVLRRLVECLGRDRTRHQVAEVTSLGLVQMTRKRIGTGLLESFSNECEHCNGRGVVIADAPVEPQREEPRGRGRRGGRGGGRRGGENGNGSGNGNGSNSNGDSGKNAEGTKGEDGRSGGTASDQAPPAPEKAESPAGGDEQEQAVPKKRTRSRKPASQKPAPEATDGESKPSESEPEASKPAEVEQPAVIKAPSEDQPAAEAPTREMPAVDQPGGEQTTD